MENKIRRHADSTFKVKDGPGSAGIWVAPSADGDGAQTVKFNPDGTAREIAQRGNTVQAKEVTFTEANAGTYTGAVVLPAGATLLDVIVNGVALWTAGTSATMKVGDGSDDDGYFTAVNLKATDLLAGESLSFANAGGKAGAYIANSQVSPRYSATARTISGVVTSVGSGTAGRTRMTVVFSAPSGDFSTASVKS